MKHIKIERPNILPIGELRTLLKKSNKLNDDETVTILCWSCEMNPAHDVHHLNGNHSDNVPENLALYCKRCHNEIHGIDDNLTELGILVNQYYSVQKQRKAMASRIRTYQNLGYNVPGAQKILIELEAMESKIAQVIEDEVKHEPIYAAYLKYIRGIGPAIGAALIVETVDPGRFNTPSKYWAYSGIDVRHNANGDGHARKRKTGEVANWNPALKSLFAYKIPGQLLRNGNGLARQLYDKYKAYYTERDAHRINPRTGKIFSPKHIDMRAKRKLGKVFAVCFLVAWRELLGLPTTEPYVAGIEGHIHIITPEDWCPNWILRIYQYRLDFPGRLLPAEI